MLCNGIFGCHGNIYYVILTSACFSNVHSIGPINVCTNLEINLYKIDEFRKHVKIVFYLTSRDAKLYIIRHGGGRIPTNQKSQPTRSLYDFRLKRYGSNSGFHVFDNLDEGGGG